MRQTDDRQTETGTDSRDRVTDRQTDRHTYIEAMTEGTRTITLCAVNLVMETFRV